VQKRVVQDLDNATYPVSLGGSYIEVVHESDYARSNAGAVPGAAGFARPVWSPTGEGSEGEKPVASNTPRHW